METSSNLKKQHRHCENGLCELLFSPKYPRIFVNLELVESWVLEDTCEQGLCVCVCVRILTCGAEAFLSCLSTKRPKQQRIERAELLRCAVPAKLTNLTQTNTKNLPNKE